MDIKNIFAKVDKVYTARYKKAVQKSSFIIEDMSNIASFFGLWIVGFFYPLAHIVYAKVYGLCSDTIDSGFPGVVIAALSFLISAVITYCNVWLFLGNKREYHSFTFLEYLLDREKRRQRYRDVRIQNPYPLPSMILNRKAGMPLGKIGKIIVGIPMSKDGTMIACYGTPGSGKSACEAVPILKRWLHSAVICDPKNELHRKSDVEKGKINIINPLLSTTDRRYSGFSPFDFLKYYDNKIEGMKNIVLSLIPVTSGDPDKVFWTASAQSYLLSGFLYFHNEEYNFSESCKHIYSVSGKKLISHILKTGNKDAKLFAGQFDGLADNTFSGILLQATTSIEVFVTDQGVINLLEAERRITPEILMDLKNPQHIYLAIPEYKLDTCKGFISMFFDMILKYFSIQDERQSVPVLFLLDEFAKYNVPSVGTSMALLRSRKVSIMFFCQSRSQIVEIYGKEKAKSMTNCLSYTVILGVSDSEDEKYFSEQIGTYEKYIPNAGHDTVKPTPIIKPEDLRDPDNVYIIAQKPRFLKLQKNFYFKSRNRKIV